MSSSASELIKQDFATSKVAKSDLQSALLTFRAANLTTQHKMGEDSIASSKMFAHCANSALNALDDAEDEIQQLENTNAYLTVENKLYKDKFGDLDEVSRQKLKDSTQLVEMRTKRERSILRLQRSSKQLLEKQK